MADWGQFWQDLFGGAGAGIQGAQNAQLQNQVSLQQALQNAMQQAQFQRQGQWHQQDVDWQKAQAEAANKRFIANMVMGWHEGARQTMERQSEAQAQRDWMTGENAKYRTPANTPKSYGYNPFVPDASTINKAIGAAEGEQYGTWNPATFMEVMKWLPVGTGHAFPPAPYAYPYGSGNMQKSIPKRNPAREAAITWAQTNINDWANVDDATKEAIIRKRMMEPK